ncbi:hypothetical protein GGE12_000132 [Rhizobium mongolense]|uniref:Uncharacterized protein n=1 Tax=Rhizobium mongolense TaxID=57676 RepID=A0A7W6WC38_9HYPH|nr:hypothetical protein [Rhizobium mongolense]
MPRCHTCLTWYRRRSCGSASEPRSQPHHHLMAGSTGVTNVAPSSFISSEIRAYARSGPICSGASVSMADMALDPDDRANAFVAMLVDSGRRHGDRCRCHRGGCVPSACCRAHAGTGIKRISVMRNGELCGHRQPRRPVAGNFFQQSKKRQQRATKPFDAASLFASARTLVWKDCKQPANFASSRPTLGSEAGGA